MRLLFACHYLVASGGLLRLEKVGAVLSELGHECAYLVFAPETAAEFCPAFPTLTFEEAARSNWDATLIPGAGFPEATLDAFAKLRAPQFGVRVQLILNAQHVRTRFLRANAAFDPDLVIFNNTHWPPGSYREFQGRQFHHLIGAVDTSRFQPRTRTKNSERFVVGAQVSKNPGPLVKALELLPSEFIIRFFGFDRNHVTSKAIEQFGDRVEYVGPRFDNDLALYYRDLDAMVSTEERAGWANVVAEAMASGVPVVTTPAGTLSIAEHEATALVIDHPTPTEIAKGLLRLKEETGLAHRLATAARTHIAQYGWDAYATRLLGLIDGHDGCTHYTSAPELGLYGKAPLTERAEGLEPLLAARPISVLDLGAAEGSLANLFLERGAGKVDAWEREADSIDLGRRLFGSRPGFSMKKCDLTLEADISEIERRAPPNGYDLTLYLGLHHHLAHPRRLAILDRVLAITASKFALRTPPAVSASDELPLRLTAAGFQLDYEVPTPPGSGAGPLHVFKRVRP